MKQNVSILLLYRGNRFLGTVSLYFGVDNTFKFNGLGACQEEEFFWSLARTMILKNKTKIYLQVQRQIDIERTTWIQT